MPRIHTSDLEDNIPRFLKERIPKARIETVFDVGANIGWVTIGYLNEFATARVWAFEPVPSIFDQLTKHVPIHADAGRASFHQCALGLENTEALVTTIPNATTNRIVTQPADEGTTAIRVERGDDFCRSNGITQIDVLKVDAEGHDMQVLLGFSGMLSAGKIDFVQVEAGMRSSNQVHIPLTNFSGLLNSLGFELLVIKNQASYELPILEWADVIFIRRKAAEIYV